MKLSPYLFAYAATMTAAVGCGGLKGLGGEAPPLATFQVVVTGDPTLVQDVSNLRVALIWGDQWLTEPFCILPAESPDAAAVIAAGCRDPFGFVPLRVAANVPITLGTPATITLSDLPSADVMIGDITARMAYGSLVAYDDLDHHGTLELAQPHRTSSGRGDGPPGFQNPTDSSDVIYGASFVTMTAPDQRIAYREGGFDKTSAFYPRSGCADPPPGFSVLAAGGFSVADGLASGTTGQLPPEDPGQCAQAAPEANTVNIDLRNPTEVREVSCTERTDDSSTRYREPPVNAPDLSGRTSACAHLPTFDAGNQSSLIQFLVSGRTTDRCQGLTHYTLRGCRENVACPVPDWDYRTNPPAWWPCPQ